MKDRFKMNRIGLVNLRLYGEEDFEFVNGKLLLRGQNASGKSTTIQSFIPFISDGDRTPSRLDPSGSNDHRMEYYFLGEEGKDESTGYLYLKLKKEGAEEYRIIAIGQKAKKGRPIDFWGFVILDGRRIGYDLQLHKEIDSSKIPLDRREMRVELGEDNFFTANQNEYKKTVNQYIFGFRKAEQYEQFIKLLVKARAPKLSKESKPTRVYETSNDSLQTLTGEGLCTMVDAMEKMDEIQDSLEILRRAFDDVKIIRNEYTRYNQYMLAKKAQAYMTMKQKIEAEQYQLNIQEQKNQETEAARNSKNQRLADLEEQEKLKGIERAGLLGADLEEIDRKLEQTRGGKEEAVGKVTTWENKIRDYQEITWREGRRVKETKDHLDQVQREIGDAKSELGEQQEILQRNQHEEALQMIGGIDHEKSGEIIRSLDLLKKLSAECKREICEYEELSGQCDELAARLEMLQTEKVEDQQKLKTAQEDVVRCTDQRITAVCEAEKKSAQWRSDSEPLPKLEEKIREYQPAADVEMVQEPLRTDYERQRQELTDQESGLEYQKKIQKEELDREKEKLTCLQNSGDLEPERDKNVEGSRKALERAGIKIVPLYETVELSENLDETGCTRPEVQLQKTGILDALVVSVDDFENIRKQCSGLLDTVLYVKEDGTSDFSKLTASEELEPTPKETVQRTLSSIYKEKEHGQGIHLGKGGSFQQEILAEKAGKTGSAEFVGALARKRRKEQKIRELEGRIFEITEAIVILEKEITAVREHLEKLQEECQELPDFSEINVALDQEKECEYELQRIYEERGKKEAQEWQLILKKNRQYQAVLQKCRPFPYGRTEETYEEADDALEEYSRIWQEIRQALLQFRTNQENLRAEKDRLIQSEQLMDDAFVEKRSWSIKEKENEIRTRQFKEYLNRPETAEKANRLKQLRKELDEIGTECDALRRDLAILEERLRAILEDEPKQEESLQQKIIVETCLRNYFEKELALKLAFVRESQGTFECAKRAVPVFRESDKDREPTDLLQAPHQVYQRHNGSLVNHGIFLEECFDTPVEAALGTEAAADAIRKRVRVVSSWNGKRVYLEEFYEILKQVINEMELLIQKKDRELFEDTLSQTISRQLTDQIAGSRKWVPDMSQFMKEMDISTGLIFSLGWKSCKAENGMGLDTAELEQILLRDHTLLTIEDIEKVTVYFRSRIRTEKQRLEEKGDMINHMDFVRNALDYRKWFESRMFFRHGEGERKFLTNAALNRFSGGEKVVAIYVLLLAAVNAQYKKAEQKDHPRIITLDKAFAGVDDKNISSVFELVHKLDFDHTMNFQALWGCLETAKEPWIAELSRPRDLQVVSVVRYTWNGREKILDAQ